MARLRTSILTNYAGQVWTALMGVVFVPLYIQKLGMEAFGLVGLMLSVQSISSLLDLGMGGVLNRELARRAHSTNASSARNLVRTFEWLVWPIALVIAMTIYFASGPIASHWLRPEHLTPAETASVVAVMGLAVALQWPSSFYSNGLSGLEQQPVMNLISASFATLRGAGVLAVLYWVSPTVLAFMWWYAAIGACQSLVSAATMWNLLPGSDQPARFAANELSAAGRFASGLFVITASSVAVTQMDRLVLSAMRPLAEVGYFSLALSIASGMARMIQPMFNALYPRFSRLVATNDRTGLGELYHVSNQCLAVVTAAVSAVLIAFSRDVIYFWTGDANVAAIAAGPMALLVGGTALNGLLNLPYALQLAHGWTSLAIGANLTALVLGIPFCIWVIGQYGVVGAATFWLLTNIGYVAMCIPLMHRRLLPGHLRDWYLRDALPPFAVATGLVIAARQFFPLLPRDLSGISILALISGVTLLATAAATPATRRMAMARAG